ncbi:hypothetical protein K8R32_01750 [bacterium]|nr:hypothetical protein [bacterium]
MRPVINCVRLAGASIPAEISERLAIESVHLYHSADKKRDFKGGTYDGRIKTDRQSINFFGVSGIGFEAKIEYEAEDKSSRKVIAIYIVTSSVLNMNFSKGYKFSTQDIEDLFSSNDMGAEEMVRDHFSKFGKDPIGKTAGSC